MKYVARVHQVLVRAMFLHLGYDAQGNSQKVEMPDPNYVEIVPEGREIDPCMVYRYKDDGTFCGDTWHENVALAKHNAEHEYGITASEWLTLPD